MDTLTSLGHPQAPLSLPRAHTAMRYQSIPIQARIALNNWLINNAQHPYMSESEKEKFMTLYSLTKKQITTYLINYRIRLLGRRKRDVTTFSWSQ